MAASYWWPPDSTLARSHESHQMPIDPAERTAIAAAPPAKSTTGNRKLRQRWLALTIECSEEALHAFRQDVEQLPPELLARLEAEYGGELRHPCDLSPR